MISKRLQAIASMIDKTKVVFDVGSDHALLPCFLLENNIALKVYAGDISEGPLNSARKNINKHHLEGKVIPVLSDGLLNANDDVDTVIISGMGYYSIENILNKADLKKYKSIIIQSNSDIELLRTYLANNHLCIVDEKIVYDKFYYQIIKINPSKIGNYNSLQIKYGPILLKNRDPLFIDYLKTRLNKHKEIYEISKNDELLDIIKEIESILYN